MDQECSVVLSKLVTSKQQVDNIEKEVMAKSKENLLIKQQIQELAGFAEDLIVDMPENWTLEDQHTAVKLVLRAIKEDETGEEVSLIVMENKDLPAIVQLAHEENKMLGQQARTLGRKVVELTGIITGITERKRQDSENFTEIEYTEPEYKKLEDYAVHGYGSSVVDRHYSRVSDDHDDLMSKVDRNSNFELRPEVETMKGRLFVKSSKAKLKKPNYYSSPSKPSTLLALSSNNAVSKLPEEEIRHTEAGHDASKDNPLMREEISKFGCKTEITERVQKCQVVLTGLGWGGLAPDLVENHARKYEGVTQVRVEGDTAVVEFMNAELASRFRGHGGYHVIEGYALEVGELVVGQDSLVAPVGYVEKLDDHFKDYTKASKVDKDLVTSVAVRVKRRRGQS